MAGMMDIFEEEATVDQTLLTLTSWVEEVDAEELVDELRSLMEDLSPTANAIRSTHHAPTTAPSDRAPRRGAVAPERGTFGCHASLRYSRCQPA